MYLKYNTGFVPSVKSGKKTHTIRRMMLNERLPRRGTSLKHFAYFQGVLRCFFTSTCSFTQAVKMDESGMKLDGVALAPNRILELAKSDGFDTAEEFKGFFRDMYGFPFFGVLISWE